jgi:hypothetical protein
MDTHFLITSSLMSLCWNRHFKTPALSRRMECSLENAARYICTSKPMSLREKRRGGGEKRRWGNEEKIEEVNVCWRRCQNREERGAERKREGGERGTVQNRKQTSVHLLKPRSWHARGSMKCCSFSMERASLSVCLMFSTI